MTHAGVDVVSRAANPTSKFVDPQQQEFVDNSTDVLCALHIASGSAQKITIVWLNMPGLHNNITSHNSDHNSDDS